MFCLRMALPRPAFKSGMTPTTRTRSAAVRYGAKFGRLKDMVEKSFSVNTDRVATQARRRPGPTIYAGLYCTCLFCLPFLYACIQYTYLSHNYNKAVAQLGSQEKIYRMVRLGGGLVCSLGTHRRVLRRARFIKPPSNFPNVFMPNSFLMQIISKLYKAQQGSPLREFVSGRRKLELILISYYIHDSNQLLDCISYQTERRPLVKLPGSFYFCDYAKWADSVVRTGSL